MHAVRKIEELTAQRPALAEDVELLRRMLAELKPFAARLGNSRRNRWHAESGTVDGASCYNARPVSRG